jgi:hypothetical protein
MTQIKKYILRLFFICLVAIVTGCRNYYNETIEWMDNIEIETNIEIVKENQPEFIEIDWKDPEIKGNENWYYIVNIKGSYDPIGMSHQLVFIENKYDRRESHK